MANDDTGQKTEKPTPRRLREARRKGQIPRSVDLVQWVTLLAASFVVPSAIRSVLGRIGDRYDEAVGLAAGGEAGLALGAAAAMTGSALLGLAVLFGFVMLSSIVGLVAQGGVIVSGHPLRPKWERISPKAGFKRLFSVQSVMETVKAIVRLTVLTVLVGAVLMAAAGEQLFAAGLALRVSTELLIDQILLVLRIAAAAGVLIGLADYAFQRRQTMKKLKMTKREVKEDQKASEGDPFIRSRRRSTHARLSRNQMLTAVGDATVIIVNPTHFAVALAYRADADDNEGGAPQVVAKGTDELSWRIRDRARLGGVPIVESPPLARALHASVEVGETIPEEFFEAVAIVLAFVFQRRWDVSLGTRRVPVPPSKIPPNPNESGGSGRREPLTRTVTTSATDGRHRREVL